MTSDSMYWLTRADYLCTGFVASIVVGALLSIVLIIAFAAVAEQTLSKEDQDSFGKFIKRVFFTGVTLILIGSIGRIFTPTTKEAAAIVLIPRIVNNENVAKENKELYDLAIEWAKAQLKPNQLQQLPRTPQPELPRK
jgi:hypothetical protein